MYLVPTRLAGPVRALAFLFAVLLVSGLSIGIGVAILLTEPRLLNKTDLWSLPAIAITAWILSRACRQVTPHAVCHTGSESVFRQHGASAWFVLLLMLFGSGLGLWLGAANLSHFERNQRHAIARAGEPAAPGKDNLVMGSSMLRLQSILYSPTSPSAVINDKTVSIGGKFGQWQVTAIRPRSVTVQNASHQTDLLLIH
jgi:hypothetical protein